MEQPPSTIPPRNNLINRIRVFQARHARHFGLSYGAEERSLYSSEYRKSNLIHAKRFSKIPAEFLIRQAGTWHAFHVVEGTSEQVEVQVGRSNGIETEVLGGIDPKGTLILHPSKTIQAGTKVVAAK